MFSAATKLLLTGRGVVSYNNTSAGYGGTGSSGSCGIAPTTAGAYVIIDVSDYSASSTAPSVTYNSVSVGSPVISQPYDNTGTIGCLYRFVVPNAAGGSSMTINATFEPSGSHVGCISAVAYLGVASASHQSGYGDSTSLSSGSLACSPGQMVVCTLSDRDYAITSPSGGTNRYNAGSGVANEQVPLCVSDATAATTFTGHIGSLSGSSWIATTLTP